MVSVVSLGVLLTKTCSRLNSKHTQIIIRYTILNHTHAPTYQKRTNGHEIRFIQKWGDLPSAHKAKILPMASLPLLHELALAKKKLVKELCSAFFIHVTKEYIKRRHGEPFKFLFLAKMGLLGRQAVLEKKSNYEQLFSSVFSTFHGQKQTKRASPSLTT